MNKRIDCEEAVANLGTILGIWAHPDDETITCGGIMACASTNGQRVACIIATKGEAGVQDESRWPAAKLGDIRAAELEAGLDVLGVKEHYLLDYHDGDLKNVNADEAIKKILTIARNVQPDTIITFDVDGLTGHDDHISVCKWASQVVHQLDKKPRLLHATTLREVYESHIHEADERFNFYFNIDKPNLVEADACDCCVTLSDENVRKKIQALRAMPSQMEGLTTAFSDEWLEDAFRTEALIEAE